MTDPFQEHGDRLRRALHADADAVIPSHDGLDRIRSRIVTRQEHRGWPEWASLPWFRPLAAAGAAFAVAAIAIAAPPVITNIIASPAGHEQPGNGPGVHGRTGGQLPSDTSAPAAPVTPGEATQSPSTAVSPATSPTATPTCPAPSEQPDEPSSPDPSPPVDPSPQPSPTCQDNPESPTPPNPRPSGSVDPTPPASETSRDPAPAAPADRSSLP